MTCCWHHPSLFCQRWGDALPLPQHLLSRQGPSGLPLHQALWQLCLSPPLGCSSLWRSAAEARAGREGHSPGSLVRITASSAMPCQGKAARDHGIAQQQIGLAQLPRTREEGKKDSLISCAGHCFPPSTSHAFS